MGRAFASPLRKTHHLTFESKQLLYPWHPWYGREVLTRKATGPYSEQSLWCRLPDDAPNGLLVAIPRWMFDSAACAATRPGDRPSVNWSALRGLQGLIGELRAGTQSEVLKHRPSQSKSHGDADANEESHSIPNQSAAVILQASAPAAMAKSPGSAARRGDQKPGATSSQRSRRTSKRSKRRASKSRRER
jgi:hypothetical protein